MSLSMVMIASRSERMREVEYRSSLTTCGGAVEVVRPGEARPGDQEVTGSSNGLLGSKIRVKVIFN